LYAQRVGKGLGLITGWTLAGHIKKRFDLCLSKCVEEP
jgi:hypothetical protein